MSKQAKWEDIETLARTMATQSGQDPDAKVLQPQTVLRKGEAMGTMFSYVGDHDIVPLWRVYASHARWLLETGIVS